MKSREWALFLARMEMDAVSSEELKAAAADVTDDRRREPAPLALPATLRRAVVTAALGDMRAGTRPRRRVPRGLAALLLLTVATTTVVVWPEGHDSRATLPYFRAVQLLRRADQPPQQYGSALAVAYQHVRAGISALRVAAGSGGTAAIRTAAAIALEELRGVCSGERDGVSWYSCEGLPEVLATVSPPASGTIGMHEVAVIREALAAGITAIRDMRRGDENAWSAQRLFIGRLSKALR